MKVLHTADWHIGKVLHKNSLRDEMILFFDWLIQLMNEEAIDLLLISGDIFDLANPAVKDQRLYYEFLGRMINCKTKVIITGGNHDSTSLINAPEAILQTLDISVIGGATDEIEDEIIVVKAEDGHPELLVAAVPFLRDRDLRNLYQEEQFEDRAEAIRYGIKKHYHELADIIKEKYPDMPSIAMGHLYARGVTVSESERDIHIGNAAAVTSDVFGDHYQYVALGHIHRPQIINKDEMIRYSGSPIALSFSEKDDQKSVVIIEVEDGNFLSPRIIPTPKFRELRRFSGTFEKVKSTLKNYKPDFPLISFVELDIIEPNFSSRILVQVEELISEYAENPQVKILKHKTSFETGALDTADLFTHGENIEDLKPQEVFEKRLIQEGLDETNFNELRETFLEVLEEIRE